jgi:hypothetical protein
MLKFSCRAGLDASRVLTRLLKPHDSEQSESGEHKAWITYVQTIREIWEKLECEVYAAENAISVRLLVVSVLAH